MCRLLETCGWLKNTHRGYLPTSFAPGQSKKGNKSVILGNFYTKKSKCFDLDGYGAKKMKMKKIEKTMIRPDYSK